MADVATPAAPQAAASQDKQQVVRPEKPDEDKYKEDLAKAEKEHAAAQEKLVCTHCALLPRRPRTLVARVRTVPPGCRRRSELAYPRPSANNQLERLQG
jgi:hypothetical protein